MGGIYGIYISAERGDETCCEMAPMETCSVPAGPLFVNFGDHYLMGPIHRDIPQQPTQPRRAHCDYCGRSYPSSSEQYKQGVCYGHCGATLRYE